MDEILEELAYADGFTEEEPVRPDDDCRCSDPCCPCTGRKRGLVANCQRVLLANFQEEKC